MAGSKEIRTKIKSVENTRKITRAMEMVAACEDAQSAGSHACRPSLRRKDPHRLQRTCRVPIRNTSIRYLVKRDNVKNVGVIVVTSDKGLCGGLNTNVLRLAVNRMKEWEGEGKGIVVCPIGNKGFGFMNRIGANIKSHLTGLGDTPHIEKLIGAVKVMLDAYVAGEIDAIHLCYNHFVNTMKQEPRMEQLLPLSEEITGTDTHASHAHDKVTASAVVSSAAQVGKAQATGITSMNRMPSW